MATRENIWLWTEPVSISTANGLSGTIHENETYTITISIVCVYAQLLCVAAHVLHPRAGPNSPATQMTQIIGLDNTTSSTPDLSISNQSISQNNLGIPRTRCHQSESLQPLTHLSCKAAYLEMIVYLQGLGKPTFSVGSK